MGFKSVWAVITPATWLGGCFLVAVAAGALRSSAAILWSGTGSNLICNSGPGLEVLNSAVKRDDSSKDTLYFKFHVNPSSDSTTEPYRAALELYEGDTERLGVGNALAAHAYSAFFKSREANGSDPTANYVDLHSADNSFTGSAQISNAEFPRGGVERTVVFKVQFVPGGDDLVTVWLNPDLSGGANEANQLDSLATRFSADASFDEIRLRHEGLGEGWIFSDLAIATAFADFADSSSARILPTESGALFGSQRFRSETWLRESGMPRGSIRALAQTADGYIWLAGADRLARFDGVRFTPFELREVTGGSPVRKLLGDAQGALWIGTSEEGLVRYAEGRFESFTTETGLPANTITALAEGKDGTVWIGTTSGLATWDKGLVRRMDFGGRFAGRLIKSLHCAAGGIVWIGVEGVGVFRLAQGEMSQLSDSAMDEWLQDAQCLLTDPRGRLWVAVGGDAVLCQDAGVWHRYRIPVRSGSPSTKVLAVEADGSIWAGSSSAGLYQFRDGKFTALNSNPGFSEDQAGALLVDRDGNLWVGGDAGLHQLKRRRIFTLGQAEGLAPAPVGGIAEVAPDLVWVVQPGCGVSRWEGESFRRLTAFGLPPGDPTLGPILVTSDGACWLAYTNGLLLFRDPQAVADESQLFQLTGNRITALAEKADGSILAGTAEGKLWRLDRGRWQLQAQLDSAVAISALAAAPDGRVWVGTYGDGVFVLGDLVQAHWKRGSGLRSDLVRSLHRDDQGVLWVGTEGGGWSAISNQVSISFTNASGLSNDTIYAIVGDKTGRLWLQDDTGLTCLPRPSLSVLSVSPVGVLPIPPGHTGTDTSNHLTSVRFPNACKTVSGRVWFATRNGVVVAEPQDLVAPINGPSLVLEEFLVDGLAATGFKPIATSQVSPPAAVAPLRIEPGTRRVELRFASPHFRASERLSFRYRMEGLDQDWIDADSARTVRYNYLRPGSYRFVVEVTAPNQRSTQVATELLVTPYLWQRWWVLSSAGVVLLAGIAGGARYVEHRRMKRRVLRLEQENALERERRRIAQDLHDEMGSKLCRLSFLSEHAKRLEANSSELKEQVSTIASDSRDLLNSLDQIVWVVNPQNDTVEHLASYFAQYAQNYFQGTGVTCSLNISNELPQLPLSSQTRHHLLLAVHEALTNVLKHSNASQVKLTISSADGVLRIEVVDDGRGFAKSRASQPKLREEETGDGLPNMHQRLEAVRGQCQIQSAPGKGTSVRLLLRLTPSDSMKL